MNTMPIDARTNAIDLLNSFLEKGGQAQKPNLDPDVQRTYLKEMQVAMAAPRDFEEGDFVEWKQGLMFKKIEGAMLVVKVLDEPLLEQVSVGTQYFNEPLDTVVLLIDPSSHQVLGYYLDSRRLQKVTL
jgi:hypothetical protein